MRLFQNSGIYPAYRQYFDKQHGKNQSFDARLKAFLLDRYNALHILSPVQKENETAFFTNGDDEILQRAWAQENGLPSNTSLANILLTQIETHNTEVFYNLDPMRYGSDFVKRLPSCVKKSVCWRAAPSPGADFSAYDRVVCNFPSIIESWCKLGWHGAYLTPSYDPAMDEFASNKDRPIDVLFVGGYSRHHRHRAEILEKVAQILTPKYQVVYCLNQSRLTRLADSPLGWLPGISPYRRPRNIRLVSSAPIFGLELYRLMSRTKIILNGAIDMAGKDRGNMRCFEALGSNALMVSDYGHYPDGFEDKVTMLTYCDADDAATKTSHALDNWTQANRIAAHGYQMICNNYSKAAQWEMFQNLVD